MGSNGTEASPQLTDTASHAREGDPTPASHLRGETQTDRFRCSFCGQFSDADDRVPVTVSTTTGERRTAVCTLCVDSIFDVMGLSLSEATDTATGRVSIGSPLRRVRPSEAESEQRRSSESHRPTGGSLTFPEPRFDGLLGAILSYHYASLAFMWQLSVAQLRVVERIVEEVDVHQLLVISMVLTTTWLTVGLS